MIYSFQISMHMILDFSCIVMIRYQTIYPHILNSDIVKCIVAKFIHWPLGDVKIILKV